MADRKDKPKIDAERIAEAAVALAGIMTYGRSAARLGNARRAVVLSERPGVRPSTVKRRTGYEPGPYGWGVETRGDASLRPAAAFGALPSGRLGAMAYVHPDVTKAYPGVLDSVSVRVVPDADWSAEVAAAEKSLSEWSKGDTASGFYDHGNNLIAVRAQMPGESLSGYTDRADKTLTHELQHMAQERDGIRPPRRHPGYEGYRADGREVEARNSANRFWLTPEERVEMPRYMTQDVKPEDVHLADKGGDMDGRHANFRNFLATDDVPDSIFGYPVAQDESRYTKSDLAFFKENPKAAGFYDTGEEGDDGTQEANLAGATSATLRMLRAPGPAAQPGTARTVFVPGLRVAPRDIELMRLSMRLPPGKPITAGDYAAYLSYQLGGEMYNRSEAARTGQVWVHNPDLVAEMFRNLRGEASLDAFRRAGVTQVSANPDFLASPEEKNAWYNRVLPATSFYFKTDDPRRSVRIANHHGLVVPASVSAGSAGGVRMDLGEGVSRGARDARGNVVVLPTSEGLGVGFKFDWQGDDKFKPYLGGPLLETLEEGSAPYVLPKDVVRLPWERVEDAPAVDVHRTEQDAKGGRSARAAEKAGGTSAEDGVHGKVAAFRNHVKSFETLRRKPYVDVDGNLAVGYGSHFLADGRPVTAENAKNQTDRDFDAMFEKDLERRIDLLSGRDRRQAGYAIPGWRHMSPESRLMLLDVSWGRKETLTAKKSKGLFGELRAAGRDKAALDDAVRRHYPSYRKATDANGVVDESKTAGLQNRRIALLKALTGEDFSYDGKKWSTEKNKFVEE